MSLYKIKSPKTLILLVSLSLITSSLAAPDCSNPLLAAVSTGWTKYTTPTAVTGLNFCKSLKTSGSACCDAATINGFQTKANTLSTTLQDLAKTRDQLIVTARDTTIPTLTAKLNALKTAAATTLTFLSTAPASFFTSQDLTSIQATTLTTALKRITTQVTDTISTLKTGLTTYQNARSTCMTELIKLQASAWCLACDPDYANKAVTGTAAASNIAIGFATDSAACTRLQAACYNYVTNSVTQSNIILANTLNTKLDDVTAAVTKISTGTGGTQAGLTDLKTAINALPAADAAASKQAAQLPSGCNSATDCPYICTTMFSVSGNTAGSISNDNAVRAGEKNTELTVSSTRILLDGGNLSSEPGNRVLAATSWTPDADESGITVSFPADPAGVNPQTTETTTANSAPKLISGVFCLIGALVGALLM